MIEEVSETDHVEDDEVQEKIKQLQEEVVYPQIYLYYFRGFL